jgi:hypothetical protein
MLISPNTKKFIDAVQQYSGDQLLHPDACALLVETASLHSMQDELADLCFTAKFIHKTFGVMKRIGSLGEGYDKLSEEFAANSAKAQKLVQSIADTMPAEDRNGFSATFLVLTPPALQAMMELVHDLTWIKNYTIDMRAKA